MLCKRCNKEIDKLEIYCDECKEILQKEKELESLIEENKKMNELESTKEFENLDKQIEEKLEGSNIREKLEDIVNNIDEELAIYEKKDNKKIVIILLIILTVLLSILLSLFIILSNKDDQNIEYEEAIDYDKIIVEYGDSINFIVSNYLKENGEIPSWSIISDLNEYDKHSISCDIHNVYKDGNIYLNKCSIDNGNDIYSYGVEQEIKEGKEINIYKNMDLNTYSILEDSNLTKVGSVLCKTDVCDYVNAYERYVLIKEENYYYIYNYENNSIEFGPFYIYGDNYNNNILSYDGILYGILYNEEGNQKIYNIKTSKTLKNINGNLLLNNINYNPSIMYKYGYVVLENNNENNFINLNSGNISYTINGNINSFIEDSFKDLVYITTYNEYNSKIIIYNSNGKTLFNGNEFNSIRLYNGNIIVMTDNNYYMYDSNLKLKLTSKTYDKVLGLYDNFIVVVEDTHLQIVDLKDNVIATYDLIWEDSYSLDNLSTGTFEENNKIIYVVVQKDNDILKYFYNLDTKEFGLK